ncbi:hypothetical protein SDC9_192635 [bioreactor metagenome]|uniref:Uncharacterized protein n=1 Tax=bioreactor metagenome TaxID=1076179 RepID=A0A645I1E3_9ZZZZ
MKRLEHLDHAEDRPEQAEQRRDLADHLKHVDVFFPAIYFAAHLLFREEFHVLCADVPMGQRHFEEAVHGAVGGFRHTPCLFQVPLRHRLAESGLEFLRVDGGLMEKDHPLYRDGGRDKRQRADYPHDASALIHVLQHALLLPHHLFYRF